MKTDSGIVCFLKSEAEKAKSGGDSSKSEAEKAKSGGDTSSSKSEAEKAKSGGDCSKSEAEKAKSGGDSSKSKTLKRKHTENSESSESPEKQDEEQVKNLTFGTFVQTKHLLPAIISSEHPLAVKYFKKTANNKWIAEEDAYSIIDDDILKSIEAPEWSLIGSRMYYDFKF